MKCYFYKNIVLIKEITIIIAIKGYIKRFENKVHSNNIHYYYITDIILKILP